MSSNASTQLSTRSQSRLQLTEVTEFDESTRTNISASGLLELSKCSSSASSSDTTEGSDRLSADADTDSTNEFVPVLRSGGGESLNFRTMMSFLDNIQNDDSYLSSPEIVKYLDNLLKFDETTSSAPEVFFLSQHNLNIFLLTF
jgi:hypothetical protein